jgi:hypothetical protein
MVGTQPGPGIGSDEKLRILEEVLQSETFARSERLKSLLRFLCEAEIEGRDAGLTEYAIGTGALGRSPDFSPLEDATVRSRIHELRQRLEKYYALEAPAAAVHIELRKGSYVPRFSPVHSAIVQVEPSPIPASLPAGPSQRPVRKAAIIGFFAGIAVMLAIAAVWSLVNRPPSPWTPELEAFWQPFISRRTPLLVAFETRFFVQMGPLVVRDTHVNSLGAVESSEPLMRVQNLFGLHQLYETGNYTDVGAPSALFHLTRLLSSRVSAMAVKSSAEMTAADVRDSNLILIGKPWLNPQLERALAAADLVDANGRIRNVHPAPGEPAEYVDINNRSDPDAWTEKYSVITMMPNPAGTGKILALTASGSEHPAALAFYVTNPETTRILFRKMRTASVNAPEYFQILVRSQFKGKELVKIEYVTYRSFKAR